MTDETQDGDATVLVVEDEPDLADLYTEYLRPDYEVLTARGGEEGVEMLSPGLDVIFLDRHMPSVSGPEVLAAIEERPIDCRIALVTAVDPDFDIIDLRIDDYLVKPVKRQEMLETARRLRRLDEYDDRVRELSAKRVKRNVLELEKTEAERENNDEFASLAAEIRRLESEVEAIAEDIDVEDRGRYS